MAGRLAKRLHVLDAAGVRCQHLQYIAGRKTLHRFAGAQDRQGTFEAPCIEHGVGHGDILAEAEVARIATMMPLRLPVR